MSNRELAELCEALPPEKQEEVADFARFLLSRQSDARWETIVDAPKGYSRLDSFVQESAAEKDEELDLRNL